jgi:hypothetical protein
MDFVASFSLLPGDARRSMLLLLDFRQILFIATTCTTLFKLIHQDAELWKLYRKLRFLETSVVPTPTQRCVVSTKDVIDSQFFPTLSARTLIKQRWRMARRIVETCLNYDGYVYGGFLRDYISKRRDFSDIDISFPCHADPEGFIGMLKCEGFKVDILYSHEGQGYGRHIVDSGNQQKLRMSKGQVQIDVDVRSDCGLSDRGADFDINCFYLRKSSSLPDTDGCEIRFPMGTVRHLTWSTYNTKSYFTEHLPQDEYLRKLIKVKAQIVVGYEETLRRCKAGQFVFAGGYRQDPSLYTARLRKMLQHGYKCVDPNYQPPAVPTFIPVKPTFKTKAIASSTPAKESPEEWQTVTYRRGRRSTPAKK